jgi:hypothetical protein
VLKNIKPVLLFCLFLIAFCRPGFAQSSAAGSPLNAAPYRNSLYLEVGGNGLLGSFNYERLFPLAGDPIAALRLGGLVIPDEKRNFILAVPAEISFINGKRNLKFEFGFGITYIKYVDLELESNWTETEVIQPFLPVFRLGGRYQKPGSPYFLRFAFTPYFLSDGEAETGLPFMPWGGVSFGYSFR